MKKIKQFLENSGIEFRVAEWGGSYFEDDRKNCRVFGLLVSFDGWHDPDASSKKAAFLQHMSRCRAYDVKPIRSYGIYSFRVLSVFDAAKLDKYEREVSDAIILFWATERAKRM